MKKLCALSLALLVSGLCADEQPVAEAQAAPQQEAITLSRENIGKLTQFKSTSVLLRWERAEATTDEQWQSAISRIVTAIRKEPEVTFASALAVICDIQKSSDLVPGAGLNLGNDFADKDQPLRHYDESAIDIAKMSEQKVAELMINVNRDADYSREAWEQVMTRLVDFVIFAQQNEHSPEISSLTLLTKFSEVPTAVVAQA